GYSLDPLGCCAHRPALVPGQRRRPTLTHPLSLHDALPIWPAAILGLERGEIPVVGDLVAVGDRHDVFDPAGGPMPAGAVDDPGLDRKSTRLNSSHVKSSYAVFCLKKKKQAIRVLTRRTGVG